jgi:anti-anti-sigma factor
MRIERSNGSVAIRLQGEFDMACVERFEDELDDTLDGETEALVLDLCGLQFMDSTGLRMLVTLNRTTSENGIDYTMLCADEGEVRRVLRETGLDGVLPVVSPSGTVPRSDSPV